MGQSEADGITRDEIVNSLLGSSICFISTVFISDIAETLLRQLLVSLGIIGVMAFDSFKIAHALIIFGVAYLICGFLGGLYTGYKAEGRLNILLFITAAVGFVAFVALSFYLGRLSLPYAYLDILAPALAGNFIGVYLGGYTIIWPYRHEEEEPSVLTIDLEGEGLQMKSEA
jgi:peptidoglycan/LPS O-acetylase OafA/YrhL